MKTISVKNQEGVGIMIKYKDPVFFLAGLVMLVACSHQPSSMTAAEIIDAVANCENMGLQTAYIKSSGINYGNTIAVQCSNQFMVHYGAPLPSVGGVVIPIDRKQQSATKL